MQAIQVKFVGPTNTRGSRYIARCDAGRLVWHADYSANPEMNAAYAARELAIKLGWTKKHYGAMNGGSLPDGSWAFVFDLNGRDGALYCAAPDAVTA